MPSLLVYAFYILYAGDFLNPLSFCSLTFCSLSGNNITSDDVRELAEALQVNQSLQKLKWVKPFKFLFLGSVHWNCSVIHRPVLILANTAQYIWHYDTSMDGDMESHLWAPTQLSVACDTTLKMPKSCLRMRLDCVHLLQAKWRGLLNHLSFCLTFCSLNGNQISAEGTHTLAKALQVNQSLQELKWVQLFMLLTPLP